jgi:diaminohydroxyphosphoribosylaminopyrimidine deaminase / 5-amino-6-(5-phosphoribosylamino)uracil reductase
VESAANDVLVITQQHPHTQRVRALERAGVEVIRAVSRTGQITLEAVLTELGRRELLSVLLEAGPTINGAALLAGIVHKLFLFYAPKISGETRVPFAIAPNLKLPPLERLRTQSFGPDIVLEAYLPHTHVR